MVDLRTPAQLAAEKRAGLSSSARVLQRQARRGYFPPGVIVKVGGRWLFNASALDLWLLRGGSLADAAPERQTEVRS